MHRLHFRSETGIIKDGQTGAERGIRISGKDPNNEPKKSILKGKNTPMERAEIVSQILAILEDVAEISPDDVNENSVLMDELDLSSMEVLTVVADLEETFGLRIPEKELRNFVTISDIADYLEANAG